MTWRRRTEPIRLDQIMFFAAVYPEAYLIRKRRVTN